MKKTKIFFVLLMFVFILSVASCSLVSNGKIYIEGYSDKDSLLELTIGTPNYSNYTVVHENGDKKETKLLEESMISDYDRTKFYQVGQYEITINAFECQCKLNIDIKRNTFEKILLNDKTVVYDGETHSLEFSKTIPSGTTVRYDIGNSFTNVGTYEITATLINEQYTTYKTTGTLTITEATYDLSGISFSDKTVVYDGKYKTIEIEGKLPKGLDVKYSIEGYTSGRVVNAGTYTVTATFTNSNSNYTNIEPLTAQLTIQKATVDLSNIIFPDATYSYDGLPKKVKIVGDLPENVSVEYTVMNSQDGGFSDYQNIIEKGTYYVFAQFVIDDPNYESLGIMIATLTIV